MKQKILFIFILIFLCSCSRIPGDIETYKLANSKCNEINGTVNYVFFEDGVLNYDCSIHDNVVPSRGYFQMPLGEHSGFFENK